MSSSSLPDKIGSLRVVEGEFGLVLRRIRRVMDERARELHPDLSAPSYWIMAALNERGPTRAADLVEAFGLDKGAVSRYVAHLVSLEFILKERDPQDGRAQLLKVTDLGRQRLEAVVAKGRSDVAAKFAGWSEVDLQTFATLLQRYNATADRTGAPSTKRS